MTPTLAPPAAAPEPDPPCPPDELAAVLADWQGVPVDVPSEQELDQMFAALGRPDPFK